MTSLISERHNLWQDPRSFESATSYNYYDPDDRPPSYDHRPPYYFDERPPPNTNDRPIYNHERASHPKEAIAGTEASDLALALALSEEEQSEWCTWPSLFELGFG